MTRRHNAPKSWLRWHGRAAQGSIRSLVVAWIAVLALVVQLAAAVQTPALASPAQAEAAAALGALGALFGPHVALCAHSEASAPGSPSHDPHKCCENCPFCQFAGHSALAPSGRDAPVLSARYAEPLSAGADSSLVKARIIAAAQPRGPPISA